MQKSTMGFKTSIFKSASSLLLPHLKVKPYASFFARQLGYELVGEGGDWNLSGCSLFSRKLPEMIYKGPGDPYFTPIKIDISAVTSRVGFSYAKDGWHPFVQTLKEYAEDTDLKYEDSALARLYTQFRPGNVQEVLLDHINQPLKPFCDWPPTNELIRGVWSLNRQSVGFYLKLFQYRPKSHGWIFFGPHDQEYGEREFHRLISVYKSIKDKGYQSELTNAEPVNGYFLKKNSQFRFVLLQGNHRVSVLKSLGYSEVNVLIRQGHPAVVDWDDLHRWTQEGGGIYPSFLVRNLFESLFNSSGREKARRYGLEINSPRGEIKYPF